MNWQRLSKQAEPPLSGPTVKESKCSMGEVSVLKRTVSPLLIVLVLTIILFDLLAYLIVPPSYLGFTEEYRDIKLLSDSLSAQPFRPKVAKGHPRYYFQADEELGFDISPGANATAKFADFEYPIFANDLGCFDKNKLYDFQHSSEYVYFAGDSMTWGYASYEKKFPTVWEQHTKKLAAKCGVSNTGQLHQFEKFKRITTVIGKLPTTVFVGFFPNDPADDMLHPHTTVISGYQVDTAFFKNGSIVRPSRDDLKNAIDSSIWEFNHRKTEKASILLRLKTSLKVYSLSANILNAVVKRYLRPGTQLAPTNPFGENFLRVFGYEHVKKHYTSDPRADSNKSAIKNWSEHARDNEYKLVFFLIPPKISFDDGDYFHQVKGWLDSCGIDYVDFALTFKKGGYKVDDLYWRIDGHLNENGNQVVGEQLSRISSGRSVAD
jgi:hypothetical protein